MIKIDVQLDVQLKEYETLREESVTSMAHRTQILSFGLATIGGLFAALFIGGTPAKIPWVTLAVMNVGVPVISICVLYIWLGEVERMMRTGFYLCLLEKNINKVLGAQVLNWENWLRESKQQMLYPYLVVILLFGGAAFYSPILGLISSEIPFSNIWFLILAPFLGGIFVLIHVYKRARKYR